MYSTAPFAKYAVVKVEQQQRLARAHQRMQLESSRTTAKPQTRRVPTNLGRRAVVACATFVLSLAILVGVAAAQTPSPSGGGNNCVRVAGARVLC